MLKSVLKQVKIGEKVSILTSSKRFQDLKVMESALINSIDAIGKEAGLSSATPSPRKLFDGHTPLKLNSPTDRPFRVSIEGNIGAGKSTLIEYFQKEEGIETYAEPIEWWRDVDGHNLLSLLYSNIQKWCSVFQSYVQLTRLKVQTSEPKTTTKVQMFERSIQNNRYCFLEQAYLCGNLSSADYAICDKWYRWIRSSVDIQLDLIVYLRSTPEVVYERMKARGRPEESGVTFEYLRDIHNAHEKWLMSDDERFNTIPVLVLDANKALEDIEAEYKLNEKRILGYEKKGSKRLGGKEEMDKVRKILHLE